MKMKRFLFAGVVAAAAFAGAAPIVALANSPHFISASSGLSGSSLTCTFKEAGLGNLGVTSISITCSATATATYECVNGGGKNPEAANKETVSTPVSFTGSFPIRNGSTSGTLTVAAPGAGSFTCPGGQKLLLASVTYTNVTVSGAGVSQSLSDQTYTNPNAPPA
jgi:hypothetical protein